MNEELRMILLNESSFNLNLETIGEQKLCRNVPKIEKIKIEMNIIYEIVEMSSSISQ